MTSGERGLSNPEKDGPSVLACDPSNGLFLMRDKWQNRPLSWACCTSYLLPTQSVSLCWCFVLSRGIEKPEANNRLAHHGSVITSLAGDADDVLGAEMDAVAAVERHVHLLDDGTDGGLRLPGLRWLKILQFAAEASDSTFSSRTRPRCGLVEPFSARGVPRAS
jgi:hypothetical protein